MFNLDDQKVEEFLTLWFSGGDHQFGQSRTKSLNSLEEYKQFIRDCKERNSPAFQSIQPVLKIEKFFWEFDTTQKVDKFSFDSSELSFMWIQALSLAKRLKNLGILPLITYSGKRGFHIWAYIDIMNFLPDQEPLARVFYKKVLFQLMGDPNLYPNFDRLPTHLNALARIPFSYHQKTGLQVVPLTLERVPYIPDVYELMKNPVPQDICIKAFDWGIGKVEDNKLKRAASSKSFFDERREVRKCILSALEKDASHSARLAYLLDAIFSEDPIEPLIIRDKRVHLFMSRFSDYEDSKTQYQIDYAREAILNTGLRPSTCETLKRWGICNEYCKIKKNPWRKK